MNRILIAEDEPRIVTFLERGLKANGFTTTVARTGEEALRMASSKDFDLLILDLGLPSKNGWDVLEDLRGRGERLPIIILTARDGIHDTVAALEGGANDYVTKPFRFEELLARVRLRLRDNQLASPEETVLQFGQMLLDVRSRQLKVSGRSVELSAREFALMETLMRHPGQVMSREQLLNHVWGYDYDPGSNIVDVYVGYIRRKTNEALIETVRGMGYRLKG